MRPLQWLAALLAVSLAASAQTTSADVCNRTAEVRDAVIAAVSGKSTCQAITNTDLAGITTLAISAKPYLTSLKAGDFAGLTSLTRLEIGNTALSSLSAGVFNEPTSLTTLELYNNISLSSLPAGVFDKLTGLTTLDLHGNTLSSLSADVFDKLTGLTTLNLWNNRLSTLPVGIFDKLTSLTALSLNKNTSLTCLPFIPASVPDSSLSLDKAKSAYDACGAAVTLSKSSVNVAKGATATYTVVLDAYPTGTVTVTPASGATGTATVSGALTFTQSNWNTTQTVTVTGVATGAATISHTIAGGGYGSVSVGTVAVTVPVSDVCTRTAEVRDAIVAAVAGKSACANITTTDLAGITTLAISNKSTLTTLKSDDLDDLTNLRSLTLSNTGLSGLPAAVFNDPIRLTTLSLTNNALSSLSGSVFDKLTRLTKLSLTNNALGSLPAGIFDELTGLTTLSLNQNNALACLPFIPSSVTTLNLDKARSTYRACSAAVTLGKSSVNVAKGATATYEVVLDAYPTGTVTVTPASSATATVTVSGALTFTTGNWRTPQTVTVTGVAAGTATISHTSSGGGYDNASAPSVTATVSETHLCIRTPQVRDAIVAAVTGRTTCGAVTRADLAGITTLSVVGDPTLTSMKAGDFAGLTNMTTLNLLLNALSSLPAGVFDPPTNLTTLTLTGNRLSTLPAGVFDNLTKLRTLELARNEYLTCLPAIPPSAFCATCLDPNQTFAACGVTPTCRSRPASARRRCTTSRHGRTVTVRSGGDSAPLHLICSFKKWLW